MGRSARWTAGRGLGCVGVALVLVVGSCSDDGGSDRPTVVVSTSIWGDVVAEVVGDCADVEVLTPAGADPHAVELSARDVAELREADLVVVNGLGLEEQIEGAVDDARSAGVPVLAIGEQLDPLPVDDHAAASDDGGVDDAHAHGDLDPHVWQDPERVAQAAAVLAGAVADHTDCDHAELDRRAAEYAAAVRAVDAAIADELAAIPADDRRLVTNHDAFRYFADRYDFEVAGTIIPSATTLAEPGSAQLAALVRLLETTGVRAVFVEATHATDLAEVLAAEVDHPVEVVELHSDSLGEPGSGADTYLGLVRTNASRIGDALTTS